MSFKNNFPIRKKQTQMNIKLLADDQLNQQQHLKLNLNDIRLDRNNPYNLFNNRYFNLKLNYLMSNHKAQELTKAISKYYNLKISSILPTSTSHFNNIYFYTMIIDLPKFHILNNSTNSQFKKFNNYINKSIRRFNRFKSNSEIITNASEFNFKSTDKTIDFFKIHFHNHSLLVSDHKLNINSHEIKKLKNIISILSNEQAKIIIQPFTINKNNEQLILKSNPINLITKEASKHLELYLTYIFKLYSQKPLKPYEYKELNKLSDADKLKLIKLQYKLSKGVRKHKNVNFNNKITKLKDD